MSSSSANTYNSFAEALAHLPILDVTRAPGGQTRINTIVNTKSERLDTFLNGFWAGGAPKMDQLVSGWVLVAVSKFGLELVFEDDNLKVRPGDTDDPNYARNHVPKVPMYIRAFGKVVKTEHGAFTVEVETYCRYVGGKITTQITFFCGPEVVIPLAGTFAGGLGALVAVHPAADDGTELGQLCLDMKTIHKGVSSPGASTLIASGAGSRSKWDAAFEAEPQGSRKKHSDTAKGKEKEREKGKDKDTGTSPINPETTFLSTAGRFMVTLPGTDKDSTVIRAVAANRKAYDFEMRWPADVVPRAGSIFDMHANLVLGHGNGTAFPIDGSVDVRPGNPSDPLYRQLHLDNGKWSVRFAGKVETASADEFSMAGIFDNCASGLALNRCRALIRSDTQRWRKFRENLQKTSPPGRGMLGQFLSTRGPVNVIVREGGDPSICIDMDHLQSAASGPTTAEVPSTPQRRGQDVSPWDTPSSRTSTSPLTQSSGIKAHDSSSAAYNARRNSPTSGTMVNERQHHLFIRQQLLSGQRQQATGVSRAEEGCNGRNETRGAEEGSNSPSDNAPVTGQKTRPSGEDASGNGGGGKDNSGGNASENADGNASVDTDDYADGFRGVGIGSSGSLAIATGSDTGTAAHVQAGGPSSDGISDDAMRGKSSNSDAASVPAKRQTVSQGGRPRVKRGKTAMKEPIGADGGEAEK